jgi:hypothetical protein
VASRPGSAAKRSDDEEGVSLIEAEESEAP